MQSKLAALEHEVAQLRSEQRSLIALLVTALKPAIENKTKAAISDKLATLNVPADSALQPLLDMFNAGKPMPS